MLSSNNLRIFAGSSAPELGGEVCKCLDAELGRWKHLPQKGRKKWYSNGCFELDLKDNCRGRHVFIIQTSLPDFYTLHVQLFELFELVMAASKAAADEITVIMPYLSYARSDKKTGRMPIVGKMIPVFLESMGMDNFFGIEFHSAQYELAFGPATNTDAPTIFPQIIEYLKELGWKNEKAIVLPGDDGSRGLADLVGEALHLESGTVEKVRKADNDVRIKSIKGVDSHGKKIILVDDEICTATTTRAVAEKVIECGAQEEIIVVTAHALFTGRAVKRLQYPPIKRIVTTNTVPTYQRINPKTLPLDVLTVAPFLSKAIEEIQYNGSVSELYKIPPEKILVEPIQWKVEPEFEEILALEKEIDKTYLDFFETVGVNSRIMRPEMLGPYRDLLKEISCA